MSQCLGVPESWSLVVLQFQDPGAQVALRLRAPIPWWPGVFIVHIVIALSRELHVVVNIMLTLLFPHLFCVFVRRHVSAMAKHVCHICTA